MPRLEFTVEEAPSLLRALVSHDAVLFERVRDALRGLEPPEREHRPDGLVHVARADR